MLMAFFSCVLLIWLMLDGASIALPAVIAALSVASDVMPLEPSCGGQSLCLRTSTGSTCHQTAPKSIASSSRTWLWFGVGTNTFAVGGLLMTPSAASTGARSTRDACMVQVPGFLPGSGHCV